MYDVSITLKVIGLMGSVEVRTHMKKNSSAMPTVDTPQSSVGNGSSSGSPFCLRCSFKIIGTKTRPLWMALTIQNMGVVRVPWKMVPRHRQKSAGSDVHPTSSPAS